MIIHVLLASVVSILNGLASFLPKVTVLPFVDAYLVAGIGYVNFLATVFPPIATMLNAFLYYIGFILILKFVKILPLIGRFVSSHI